MEETSDPTRKEFGYRQSLINQIERIGFISANILQMKKKSGIVSKINAVNFRYAIRTLAILLKPYWDDKLPEMPKKKDMDTWFDYFGEVMELMKRTKLLLEKEITLDEDGSVYDDT